MRSKKVLAAALAATMLLGSTVTAFADEGTASGTGTVEGVVKKDVFNVVLPTESTANSALAFILDPQGLIKETSGSAHTGKTFEDATLYFPNTGDKYTGTSDEFEITNKSTVDADVSVKATVTDNDGITLSTDKTFANDTSASMYLAIVDDDHTDGVAIEADGATVTSKIDKAPDGAYKITYDTDSSEYKYDIDSGFQGSYSKYTFKLTGASNANGDWEAAKDVTPKVSLTWTVTEHEDTYSSTNLSGSNVELTISKDGVQVSSVEMIKTDGTNIKFTVDNQYKIADKKITFKQATIANNVGATIKITYSDGHIDSLVIQ